MKTFEFVYDCEKMFSTIVQKELSKMNIQGATLTDEGSLVLRDAISADEEQEMIERLRVYGVEEIIISTETLIEQIKSYLKMEISRGSLRSKKMSVLLTEKFGYTYPHLSALFSKETFTTIENFCIF
ncbi:MAG: hypothetical protein R3359_01620, partial [Marinirhabdus sp.]|nr:hypothetical protein [Marinirhabdus sp.]